MAESLRRLVNTSSFGVLQDKLERWLDNYYLNTADQNVSRCCDIIELNSRVQAQLFKLLHITASEGSSYAISDVIKRRLLPFLGSSAFHSFGLEPNLALLEESAAKDREINSLQDMYEQSLGDLEADLKVTQAQADELKAELEDTKDELEQAKRQSVSDKMFGESEVRELKAKLRLAEDELATMRARVGLVDDYERQIRRLRDDIAILSGRKELLSTGFAATESECSRLRALLGVEVDYQYKIADLKQCVADLDSSVSSPSSLLQSRKLYRSTSSLPASDLQESLDNYRFLPRSTSPLSSDDVTQRVRQQSLISRFNSMFAQDRLDAMDILRRYSDDYENNQRIIFTAMQEAFSVAKLSFSQFKSRVRSNLAITHMGPETLEEAVQDYINRNNDMYDLPGMVSDVIRGLNRSLKISLPAGVSYSVIQPFIREACKLAWGLSSLAHPLDIALATDAELFSEAKYRRSYDSEFTAPLVNHHIWPCLMQGTRCIMKGEANTRRGASLSAGRSRSPTRSLSPSRALSPRRSVTPSRARSRSPSPRRPLSSMELGSSLSGRSSPALRSRSPSRASSSLSRPVTSSTSLSHYGVRS